MDHDDSEHTEKKPEDSSAYESLVLAVRWVDAEGNPHTAALSDGRHLRYVGHLIRLLGGETPPYPEPVVERTSAALGEETDSPRRFVVLWSDGDECAFTEGSMALAYVLRLQAILGMPERERWLHLSPEARFSLDEGLGQAARREVRSLGSFARHAEGQY